MKIASMAVENFGLLWFLVSLLCKYGNGVGLKLWKWYYIVHWTSLVAIRRVWRVTTSLISMKFKLRLELSNLETLEGRTYINKRRKALNSDYLVSENPFLVCWSESPKGLKSWKQECHSCHQLMLLLAIW